MLKGTDLVLGGDGGCDSSGYLAKYGSYCFLDSSSKKIIQLALIKNNQVRNSVGMELKGLTHGLKFLIKKGMKIKCLVTDRHIQIRDYLKKAFPQIKHLFYCWHIVKSLRSKISKACGKKKNMEILLSWSRSIQNHLYWLASSSGGDASLMQSKWLSILQHVRNIHDNHDQPFERCSHGKLLADSQKQWLNENSPCYQQLVPIITKLTKDVCQISNLFQRSSMEAFHSVVVQFAPKNTHFSFHAKEARLLIAALHYNENSEQLQAIMENGKCYWNKSFPKYKNEKFSIRPIKGASSYNYIENLMKLVVQYSVESNDDGGSREIINTQYHHTFKEEAFGNV